ncbi:unnamed protein product [Schistocephalus solidus]|uniref:Plastocyanin-like domain-containing protein n=1 Tax=Schistocephalus solidus TaxID=70667 RepID=A0A183SBW8_SCHSO|nr:unnamed protein product [Schistocephalus solidus]
MERVSTCGGRPLKPDKLIVYDVYDLWEYRMKVYLEAVDEVARPAAILGRLDNEVYTADRTAIRIASLTPGTIFELSVGTSDAHQYPGLPVPPSRIAANTHGSISSD